MSMYQPKYQIGMKVLLGVYEYIIKAIDTHGGGNCDCCPKATTYFMYNLTSNVWVNEDQIQRPPTN